MIGPYSVFNITHGNATTHRAVRIAAIFLLALTSCGAAVAPTSAVPRPTEGTTDYGPPRGTLVIAGGGDLRDTGIVERFIARAGGPDAKIIIVPTAGGNRHSDGQLIAYSDESVLATWQRQFGLTRVTLLHTHDPQIADTADFTQPLREASGVWFNGGRQWNLVDSYANTLTAREFHAVLARGGVIGGSSAGATIQGDYLVRGAISGPSIMMAPEPEHQHGFAFLRRSAIDQHVDTRNRWDDLIPVIKKFPAMIGLGLSEGTAIIVTRDRFEVIGKGLVAIHDNTRAPVSSEKPYILLAAGDQFDLKTRTTEKAASQTPPAVTPASRREQ